MKTPLEIMQEQQKVILAGLTEKKKDTCPCGMNGACCANPKVHTAEHECSNEEICEGCYELVCDNCGKSCSHEL